MGCFLILLLSCSICFAQMINWKRRAESSGKVPAPTEKKAKPTRRQKPKAPPEKAAKNKKWTESSPKKTERTIVEEEYAPKVTKKVEELYDLNGDGRLQKKEINEFFQEVYDAIRKKGHFIVISDLLKKYDKDRDGFIDKYEAKYLKKDIR